MEQKSQPLTGLPPLIRIPHTHHRWQNDLYLFRLPKGVRYSTSKMRQLKARYTNKDMKNHFNNSVLFQKHFYGMDGNSNLGRIVRLNCLDQQTGKVKWREAGFGCGSLLISDGKLIILSDEGTLVTAKAHLPNRIRKFPASRSSTINAGLFPFYATDWFTVGIQPETLPALMSGHKPDDHNLFTPGNDG